MPEHSLVAGATCCLPQPHRSHGALLGSSTNVRGGTPPTHEPRLPRPAEESRSRRPGDGPACEARAAVRSSPVRRIVGLPCGSSKWSRSPSSLRMTAAASSSSKSTPPLLSTSWNSSGSRPKHHTLPAAPSRLMASTLSSPTIMSSLSGTVTSVGYWSSRTRARIVFELTESAWDRPLRKEPIPRSKGRGVAPSLLSPRTKRDG